MLGSMSSSENKNYCRKPEQINQQQITEWLVSDWLNQIETTSNCEALQKNLCV